MQFRLTEADYEKLAAEAEKAGIVPNECARLKTTGGVLQTQEQQSFPTAMIRELNKVGINVNQIARKINMTGEYQPDVLEETCQYLNEVLRTILANTSD